jgi:mRNA interferase MazF
MKRGEVYLVRKPGGDLKRSRAFVIISRQVVIDSSFSTVVCAPVFSSGAGLRTQVPVGVSEGLKRESWIMCDNLVSLAKSDLTHFVGALSSAKLAELDRALRVALDLR